MENRLMFYTNYSILRDGKIIKNNILSWRDALAHASNAEIDLFGKHTIEILNVMTGEIVNLKEAQERAKAHNARQ